MIKIIVKEYMTVFLMTAEVDNLSDYKISIIIPVFNLEDKIEDTFNSIKSQTIGFDKLEIIFVDDESTDNTTSIINNYVNDYDNVFLLNTGENSGFAGKPRNIGLNNANSDYVLFLDGDDQLLINSCEVLYNKITSTNADIVIGGQINVFDGIHQHNPPLFGEEETIFKNMLNPKLLNIRPAISAKLFKRGTIIHNNIKFPEGISGQDLVFFTEALLNSNKVVTLNDFYVYYRNLSDTSITLNLNQKYLCGLIKAYTIVCDILEKFNVDYKIQTLIFCQHLSFFTTQVLRAQSSQQIESATMTKILNSNLFKNLAEKSVFSKNKKFNKYFNNMSMGKYNNHHILNEIYNEINFNQEIISDANFIKREIRYLKNLQNKTYDENKYLKKQNYELINENNELKDELYEIKSSKLWKLKNKF